MYIKRISKKIVAILLLVVMSFSFIISPVAAEVSEIRQSSKYISSKLQKNESNNSKIVNEKKAKKDLKSNKIKNREAITDRYIIKYKSEKREKAKERIEETIKSKLKTANMVSKKKDMNIGKNKMKVKNAKQNKSHDVIQIDKKMKLEDLASLLSLEDDEDIEYIQPDYELKLEVNDTYLGDLWGLHNVIGYEKTVTDSVYNHTLAWDEIQGEGIVVAVIDTGIDIDHEDLKNNIWVNEKEIPDNGIDDDGNGHIDDIKGWNFHDDTNSVKPKGINEIHGTHIAGIIAAEKDNEKGIAGVAPRAKILPLKVFSGDTAYTSDIIEAIEYAKEMGADIVNCSWGGTDENPVLKEAIEESGLLFIVSAGNGSKDIDIDPVYPASYDNENILAVSSIDKENRLSYFSNYGQDSVDIVAPGEEIVSTLPDNKYGKLSGTSMSTAFVSGVATFIKGSDNEFSTLDIKSEVINTSIDTEGLKIVSINNLEPIAETENFDVDLNDRTNEDLNLITGSENGQILVTDEVYSQTVYQSVYIDTMFRLENLISNNDLYSELNIEEKEFVYEVLNLDNIILEKLDEQGYELREIIDMGYILKKHEFSYEDVVVLLSNFTTSEMISELIDLNEVLRKNNFSKEHTNIFKNYLKLGYKVIDIKEAYIVSTESPLNMESNSKNNSLSNYELYSDSHSYKKYFNDYYTINKNSNETIQPGSGALKFEHNIMNLPGRNGLDVNLKLRYDIKEAYLSRPFAVLYSGNRASNQYKNQTFNEKHYALGVGWSLNLPAIEITSHFADAEDWGMTEQLYSKFLHLGDGRKYEIPRDDSIENIPINGYELDDLQLSRNSDLTLGNSTSKYLLEYKNGRKDYFDDLGNLMIIKDRNENKIEFYYEGNKLSRIVDTIGREINIEYNTLEDGNREVIFTSPDETAVKLLIEKIDDIVDRWDERFKHTNNYKLKTLTDKANRTIDFNYATEETGFNLVNPEWYYSLNSGRNCALKLTEIKYETDFVTNYTYEMYTRYASEISSLYGYNTFRVKNREEIEDGEVYNREEYTYFDGNTANEEQDRSTTIKNCENTVFKYFFDDEGLIIREEVLKNGDIKIKETSYTYDNNKMTDKTETTVYDYNGDELNSDETLILETDYDYNNYGDLLKYVGEEGHVTEYQYDDNFHRVKLMKQQIDDSRWKKTEYNIDPSTGNINWIKQHHVEGSEDKSTIIKYPSYDSYGNVLEKQIETFNGTVIMKENYSYGPDEEGKSYNNAYLTKRTVEVTDYEGNKDKVEEKYTYYPSTGLLKTYRDGRGNLTTYEYDNLGRKTKEINTDTSYKVIDYDDINNIVTLTTENGHKVRQIYDGLGRLKNIQNLMEGTTDEWITLQENSYNALSQLEWTKDVNGIAANKKTSYEYDVFGRVTRVTNPDLTYTETKYYDVLNKKVDIDEEQKEYISIYDKVGNLREERVKPDSTKPLEYVTIYDYDYLGNLTHIKDPRGNVTTYGYDDLGRLKEVENPKQEKTSYKYNSLGNLTKLIMQEYDNAGELTKEIITEKEYDELGRLMKSFTPYDKAKGRDEAKVTKIAYDRVGNIDHSIDMEGQRLEYTYDNLNRILIQTAKKNDGEVDSLVTYDYTNLYTQNKMTITDGTGITTYEYYADGKLKKESLPNSVGKNTIYEYYDDGNLQYITDPFGLRTEYTYDSRNRIDLIKVDGKTFNYDYHNDGMIKTLTYPNPSIKTEFTYYGTNQLSTLKNTIVSEIDNHSYGYDPNGNISNITENAVSTSYTYDKLNRLDIMTRPDNKTIDFSYDARGNRKEIQASDYDEIDYLHRLKPGEYKYNPLNQLESYTTNGDTYQYKYSHRGLRTEKITPEKTIKYHYDQAGRTIAESDETGNLAAQIIWGHKPLARKVNGQYYYYLYNGHGDVVKVVDESGNIVNRYAYDEWGNILDQEEQIENPIRYAGEYFDDESGLYYLRARYYDPTTGRFISKDSYEGKITNPLSLNLYTYCYNNPLKYVDPSGHYPNDLDTIPGMKMSKLVAALMTMKQYVDSKFYQIVKIDEFMSQWGDKVENILMNAPDVMNDIKDAFEEMGQPVNKNGKPYPEIKDPRTGENIKFPVGELQRVPKDQRVEWDSYDRYKYIKEWYDRGYETPTGGWENYDIHHIQPREFGGDNSFWNLAPVERTLHQQQFNPFWLGY